MNQNVSFYMEFKIKVYKDTGQKKIAWESICSAFNKKYDCKCIDVI